MMSNSPVKEFKVKKLPKNLQPSSLYYVKVEPNKFKIYLTDSKCPPTAYSLDAGGSAKIVVSPDGSIQVAETPTETQIQVSATILAQINSALQPGDNISELSNDVGYITIADVPEFDQNNFVRELSIFINDLPEDYTEEDIINYILALPPEERTITETDSKWNIVIGLGEDTVGKIYELKNIGKGLIEELDSFNNLRLIYERVTFNPTDYDLEQFANNGSDPYAHQSEISLQSALQNGGHADFNGGGETYSVDILTGTLPNMVNFTTNNGIIGSEFGQTKSLIDLKNYNFSTGKAAGINLTDGRIELIENNNIGTTSVKFKDPLVNSLIRFPAPSVSGTYDLATTADIPDTSNFVSKTGNAFEYSIDFDPLISQDPNSLELKKRDLRPESTRLTPSITTIYGWGDSLTSANGGGNFSYLYHINALTGFTMVNKGTGGGTSTSIKTGFIADTADYDKTVIIWVGRNNYYQPEIVKADIATMVSALTHSRFLVMGIVNGNWEDEWIGTVNWQTINDLNSDLKEIYGKKFIDIRPYLVSQYTNSAQDIIDHGNDVTPTSLRSDELHFNEAGAIKIAEYVNTYLGILYEKEEYFQSKDFLYYYNLYDNNLHKSGNETFTGKKTSTNTTVPFTNGLVLNNSGGASSKSIEMNISGANGKGIDIIMTATGFGTYGTNTGSGTMHRVDNPNAGGVGYFCQNLGNSTAGFSVFNGGGNAGTQGVRIDNSAALTRGYWGINRNTGVLNENFNLSTGVLNSWDSATASTGDLLRITKNSVLKTKIDSDGFIVLSAAPDVSASAYDILTRNTSTGKIEKIPRSSIPLFYTNATTTALTSATLTSTYTSATIGSEVHALSITGGGVIYKKTSTGWASILATVTP